MQYSPVFVALSFSTYLLPDQDIVCYQNQTGRKDADDNEYSLFGLWKYDLQTEFAQSN